jgi:mono/diheme cytochrome c family protein
MRSLILLFTIILSTSISANTRVENHHKSVKEFRNLNFFYKGRGMVISPDLINLYEVLRKRNVGVSQKGILNQRWGINLEDNKIVGIFNEPYKKMNIGVLGCVACHSGRAAGELIIGLGNKNIDVGQIGIDTYRAQKVWGIIPRKNPNFKTMHERSVVFTKKLKNPKIHNLTQGLVPTSLVKSWFYDVQGVPFPKNFGRGQVKVPQLWGYGEKRKTGSFWDGVAKGDLPGWAIAVELYAGQTAKNVHEYIEKVEHAEDLLDNILPPKYPFKINTKLATKGKKLFTKNCMGCHGSYERDSQNNPMIKSPKFIPHRIVKTDPERLSFADEDFYKLIDTSPLNDIIQYIKRDEKGYIAPRLWGVWSRFPYLHNASVPTVYELLSPQSERSNMFSLKFSGELERFDKEKMGLTKVDIKKRQRNKRYIYNTDRIGHKNIGHEYKFYKTLTHQNRLELIEYLKTL